eukprot:sb/3475974/
MVTRHGNHGNQALTGESDTWLYRGDEVLLYKSPSAEQATPSLDEGNEQASTPSLDDGNCEQTTPSPSAEQTTSSLEWLMAKMYFKSSDMQVRKGERGRERVSERERERVGGRDRERGRERS